MTDKPCQRKRTLCGPRKSGFQRGNFVSAVADISGGYSLVKEKRRCGRRRGDRHRVGIVADEVKKNGQMRAHMDSIDEEL